MLQEILITVLSTLPAWGAFVLEVLDRTRWKDKRADERQEK